MTGVRIAVLVSGTGSLLEAMLAAEIAVALVVADRDCRGISLAEDAGITAVVHEREDYSPSFDRDTYSAGLVRLLEQQEIDVVAMAGFGTCLLYTSDAADE